jgi:hypothetical protein
MTKRTTSAVPQLDMREIARWIYPDEEFWLPRGVGKAHTLKDRLLIFLADGRHAEVRYTSTPCNFGGTRLWFVCNECRRRALVLYLVRRVRFGVSVGEFVCRRCGNLCYLSQLENPMSRALRAVSKVRQRSEPV